MWAIYAVACSFYLFYFHDFDEVREINFNHDVMIRRRRPGWIKSRVRKIERKRHVIHVICTLFRLLYDILTSFFVSCGVFGGVAD